jgi:hypothetical protein
MFTPGMTSETPVMLAPPLFGKRKSNQMHCAHFAGIVPTGKTARLGSKTMMQEIAVSELQAP